MEDEISELRSRRYSLGEYIEGFVMADHEKPPRQSPEEGGSPQPFVEIVERSQQIVNEWLSRNAFDHLRAATTGSLNLATLFIELASQVMTFPASVVNAQMSLWQDYFSLWQSTTSRLLGREIPGLGWSGTGTLIEQPWQDVDIFSYVKQSYLLVAGCVREMVAGDDTPETAIRDAMDFYARQFVGALSPTNFAVSNPEVIRAAIDTRGENLINGLQNLLKELEAVRRGAATRTAEQTRFAIGQTLATTPGKVIFRNEVMELIQYQPTCDRVLKRPLLFVPAWLNKYYVLDLRTTNSLVRWAIDQGHTVFMISWVDPQGQAARMGFADYVLQGPVRSLDIIQQACGEVEINAVGHCLGGTLLASALAYLAENGDDRIKTGTFLTAMLDFSQPGELGALMDEATLCQLDDDSREQGGADVSGLAKTWSMQRDNDLIWSFVVNNYLLGRDPFPFDLLHWNWDSPRVPLGIHKYYLEHFYRCNRLVESDGIAIGNRYLDLRKVKIPTYVLSAREDHITPWKSAYKTTRLLCGGSRFTLAASGHLAGVVNPPAANKYCYWTNPKTPDNPEDWRAGAKTNEGSWWRDWDAWIKKMSNGDRVPACEPGTRKLKPLCDAPGTYVMGRALKPEET
jgi:polyhydroxyalkanoate synthase